MLSIENQIAAVQGILKDGYYRESDATLIESILSSLERLRDADEREHVAYVNYVGDISPCSDLNAEGGFVKLSRGQKLYALPPLPAIPEGFALVPIKPTKEMIDAMCEYMGGLSADKRAIYAYKDAVSAAQVKS